MDSYTNTLTRREVLKLIAAGASGVALSSFGLTALQPDIAHAAQTPYTVAQNKAYQAALKAAKNAVPNVSIRRTKRVSGKRITSGKHKGKTPVTSTVRINVYRLAKTSTATYKSGKTTKKVSRTVEANKYTLTPTSHSIGGHTLKNTLRNGAGYDTFTVKGYAGDKFSVSVYGEFIGGSTRRRIVSTTL